MPLELIALRMHHALTLMPCGCSRQWVPARTSLRGGPLKAEVAVIRKCIRCAAIDLYEASEFHVPPHVDAA
jgi:hypothetical protein